jgi:tRNA pseudouridine55 synthase
MSPTCAASRDICADTLKWMDGIIVVDKPEGWTSHDVVNKMRELAGIRKVGHLGTLDPAATGVLPLVLGRATRLSQFLMKGDKEYQGVVRFGHSTTTYDREGEPLSDPVAPELDRSQIESFVAQFRGVSMQTPPPISAKKIRGERAYRLARRKAPVPLEQVEVRIDRIEITSWEPPDVGLFVRCSAGTYLRTIAHELGQMAGCGAFLNSLRRTASGAFTLAQAHTLGQLADLAAARRLDSVVVPAAELLPEFPGEYVDHVTAAQIRHGRDFRVSPFGVQKGSRFVKAIGPEGELLAIGEMVLPNLYHPVLVL